MKNSQRGFIMPLLLAIIAILLVGGGIYVYVQNKPATKTEVATTPATTVTPHAQATSTKETKTYSATTFATLDTFPSAMAFDSLGNLYMVGSGLYQITKPLTKISPSGVVTVIATVPAGIDALIFDKSDNLYGMNGSNDTVVKITTQGVIATFATVGSQPRVMGFDTAGNLYTANLNGDTFRESNNTNTISKVAPSGSVTSLPTIDFKNSRGAGTGNDFPLSLAFDASGNLYAALIDKRIIKITSSGIETTFVTLDSAAKSIAFDASGNLYTRNDKNINKITPSGAVTTLLEMEAPTPSSSVVVFDTLDNLYVVNSRDKIVYKISSTSVQ